MDKQFVEIDGKKFLADEKGEVIKGEDGSPVPFVEDNNNDGKAEDKSSLEDKPLEELAKLNPAIKRLIDERNEMLKKLEERAKAEEAERRKNAEKNGEWQKIADEERAKRELIEKKLAEKEELLGKYKGSVESILKEAIKTIPEEKRSLIPDKFSPREKLEYITRNAAILGAKIIGSVGDKVDKNDEAPNTNEEAKLVAEIEELMNKGANRTHLETNLMLEKSRKLQELRASKK